MSSIGDGVSRETAERYGFTFAGDLANYSNSGYSVEDGLYLITNYDGDVVFHAILSTDNVLGGIIYVELLSPVTEKGQYLHSYRTVWIRKESSDERN